jgi:hypothetical protein
VAAVVGASLAVAGWAAWSALDAADPVASPTPVIAPIALAQVVPQDVVPAARSPEAKAAVRVVVPPLPEARALPVAPEGFLMVHGQLTAERAPVGPPIAALAPIAARLPPGVRPEDASVSPGGTVSVTRTGAANTDAGSNPPRVASVTRSP